MINRQLYFPPAVFNLTAGGFDSDRILTGHARGVTSLVALPNGDLASGSGDKTIRLWNIQSG